MPHAERRARGLPYLITNGAPAHYQSPLLNQDSRVALLPNSGFTDEPGANEPTVARDAPGR